jgi:ketosteroid isomerase-like protein
MTFDSKVRRQLLTTVSRDPYAGQSLRADLDRVIGDLRALRRFYRAFNAQDLPALLATVHPDVVFLPILGPLYSEQVYRGHAGIATWYDEIRARWDAFEARLDELHEAGDLVIGFLTLVAHRDGRPLEAKIAVECGFRAGRIHRMRGRDLLETAEQLGVRVAAA